MAEHQLNTARIEAVVIGASAGGIEALSVVLPALPAGLRVPVLVVLHLPRERPSLLVDVFEPKCAVPVREAVDKEPIAAGTVYFAPPDYHLLIDEGPAIALSDDEPVHHSRPSVDVLFESAADAFGAGVLAILLTGGNEDGAAGLAAVREAGGTVVVQDPEEAYAPTMVTAALARGPVHQRLRLQDIAELLSGLRAGKEPGRG
jgi:two-component system, chemotaxis family, protein-glutamate methylesterase/glutaminase